MSWHTIDHASSHFWVNEPTWKNRKLSLGNRVFESLADKLPPFEEAFNLHLLFLVFQLLSGLLTDYPIFPINISLNVVGIRVYPNVCYTIDCFGAESCRWKISVLVELVLDKDVF